MKNYIKQITVLSMTVVLAAACEKDGEKLIVSAPEAASGLSADPTEIVLSSSNKDDLAVTFYWTNGAAPTVSNPNVSLPDDIAEMSLQFSKDETFADVQEQQLEYGVSSAQLTVSELNSIVLKLGYTEETASPVMVRVQTEMSGEYMPSESITLSVTPYVGDSGTMLMQSTDLSTTFATLRNSDSNEARYSGFAVTTAGWYNFYFVAADGTVWGNDGVVGTPFVISSAETKWNCWFAGTTGCHYVYMDTELLEWWQIHMPEMEVSDGTTTVKMKFSTSKMTWTGTITTTSDNAVLTVGGTGAKYDQSVGTNGDAVPIDNPYTIVAGSDGTFSYSEGSVESGLTAGTAGTYTLTLDISSLTYTLAEGGSDEPAVTYPDQLYVYYYKKEASDKLDRATILNAISGSEGQYQGFLYTDPNWGDSQSGFRFLTSEGDDATIYYTNTSQYSLTTDAGGWNFWSSNPGLNYITVDLTEMTWSETKVSQIAVAGDFNSWSLTSDTMSYDTESRKWIATCNVSYIEWGLQFVITKDDGDGNDWDVIYVDPDGDGTLQIGGDNIKPSSTGVYKFELDLCSYDAPTYTMTAQ